MLFIKNESYLNTFFVMLHKIECPRYPYYHTEANIFQFPPHHFSFQSGCHSSFDIRCHFCKAPFCKALPISINLNYCCFPSCLFCIVKRFCMSNSNINRFSFTNNCFSVHCFRTFVTFSSSASLT